MIEGLEAGDIKGADVAQPDPGQAGNLALMRSQLESLNARLKSENTQLAALKTKVSEYRSRLEKSPEVEREYLTVSRDYDAALNRYRELKSKEMDARLAAALEQTDKGGERFSIIEPAAMPSIPYKPERGMIIALGFVLSLAAAVGMAVLLEIFDRTVHGKRGLAAAINAPPIGVIPNMA